MLQSPHPATRQTGPEPKKDGLLPNSPTEMIGCQARKRNITLWVGSRTPRKEWVVVKHRARRRVQNPKSYTSLVGEVEWQARACEANG